MEARAANRFVPEDQYVVEEMVKREPELSRAGIMKIGVRSSALSIVRTSMLLALFSIEGCTAVRTPHVEVVSAIREARDNIVLSHHLSHESRQLLRMAGLEEENVFSGVSHFDPEVQLIDPPLKRFYVRSEIAMARAMRAKQKLSAAGDYLDAAQLALKGLSDPACEIPLNLLCDNLTLFYGQALIGITNYLEEQGWHNTRVTASSGSTYELLLEHDSPYEDPALYSSVRASANIGVEGLPNVHIRYGVGLALTACRPKRNDNPEDVYLPVAGTCLPLTAILQFPDSAPPPQGAVYKLYNSLCTERVFVRGRWSPLAADFTAPLASLVQKTERISFDDFYETLTSSESLLKSEGFYSIEPYDTGKIPLITVHGLFSSPLTWIRVQNDLMSDDVIRRNYQVWHYLYPTNLPILENAKTFRARLDELEAHREANGAGAHRGMVIIAHSMGGLLTKTAVAGESSVMRNLLLDPEADLQALEPDMGAKVESYLAVERKPYIERVVFIAVPHRGSDVADNWIGRLGRRLIALPKSFVSNVSDLLTGARSVFRPEISSELARGDISSIRSLSPTNPIVNAMSAMSVASDVPFHSIIGDRGRGDTPLSSDGVVPYSSSHLSGARSELIVPAGHSAHSNPLAIREIRRILYLHLAERKALSCGASDYLGGEANGTY